MIYIYIYIYIHLKKIAKVTKAKSLHALCLPQIKNLHISA